MKNILTAVFALVLLHATALAAAADAPGAAPDPSANPVLANIQKLGAKFFYLGKNFGLDGWFIVKSGQVQILYATPDNKAALVGALFGENGDNVTVTQVARLVHGNKEVAELIANAQKEQLAIAQAGVGAPPPAAAAVPPGTIPSATLSPGERLIKDLSAASTVTVGANAAAPEIFMVMDPNCPHCQDTWKIVRDLVVKGALRIRMVPIGTADTDDEKEAAVLLASPDPLDAWDKYVAGDKTKLAGTPLASSLIAVRSNHMLIDSWKIQKTPYLVYRAKDGTVKVVEGEPSALAAVLSDLGL